MDGALNLAAGRVRRRITSRPCRQSIIKRARSRRILLALVLLSSESDELDDPGVKRQISRTIRHHQNRLAVAYVLRKAVEQTMFWVAVTVTALMWLGTGLWLLSHDFKQLFFGPQGPLPAATLAAPISALLTAFLFYVEMLLPAQIARTFKASKPLIYRGPITAWLIACQLASAVAFFALHSAVQALRPTDLSTFLALLLTALAENVSAVVTLFVSLYIYTVSVLSRPS